LRENVRTNELVTNDTTPHVYGKAMLVVAFDTSMWIITTPYMGVSCIVYSIACKIGLIGEQNVTNHTGVRINPTAQISPATHVRWFKMLNALDVVRIRSFCEQRSPDTHARNTEAGRNSSCTSAWTSLYHVNVFIILHISLYLTFSMAIYTWKGNFFSQKLMYMSEHTSVRDSSSRIS
jgi:hypothetical protein